MHTTMVLGMEMIKIVFNRLLDLLAGPLEDIA